MLICMSLVLVASLFATIHYVASEVGDTTEEIFSVKQHINNSNNKEE